MNTVTRQSINVETFTATALVKLWFTARARANQVEEGTTGDTKDDALVRLIKQGMVLTLKINGREIIKIDDVRGTNLDQAVGSVEGLPVYAKVHPRAYPMDRSVMDSRYLPATAPSLAAFVLSQCK
jgi:hypothetical protein